MSFVRKNRLPEGAVYELLSSPRRRELLRQLPSSEWMTLKELSESVAAAEAAVSPAPRDLRSTVYTSLYQTHVPRLQDAGVVEFDPTERRVRVVNARGVDLYMDYVTRYGVTWGELYQWVGVVGLSAVIGSLADLPGLATVDPLLWASGSLAAIAGISIAQLSRPMRRLFGGL